MLSVNVVQVVTLNLGNCCLVKRDDIIGFARVDCTLRCEYFSVRPFIPFPFCCVD